MKQDLKDYFRRTMFMHGGVILGQIMILCFGVGSIANSILVIATLEIVIITVYLIFFGIKRKDGTLIRFKKIDKFMREYEEIEQNRKETLKLLQSYIDKHKRKKHL